VSVKRGSFVVSAANVKVKCLINAFSLFAYFLSCRVSLPL